MVKEEDMRIIKELEPALDEILNELDAMPDSMFSEEAETFSREISYLTSEDLLRQFTI